MSQGLPLREDVPVSETWTYLKMINNIMKVLTL